MLNSADKLEAERRRSMNIVKYWYLEDSFNMMKRIGMRQMMKLCDLLVMKTYQTGTLIRDISDSEDTIYFIKKRQVKIGHREANGEETLRYVLGKGHIFGESRIMGDDETEYFAKTISETQICFVEADMMLELLERYPRLNNVITKISWRKISKMERRLQDLLYKDAKTRILDFLKDHAQESGTLENDEYVAKNPYSHTDIAKLTSTSRQTVNNVISKQRKQGELYYDRGQIRIKVEKKK